MLIIAHPLRHESNPRVRRIFSPPPRDAWLRQPVEFRAHRRVDAVGCLVRLVQTAGKLVEIPLAGFLEKATYLALGGKVLPD